MSQFTGILRQITKKASHPNSLLYQVQLGRAKTKYLDQGQLDDGTQFAFALGAPKEEGEDVEKKAEGDVASGVAGRENLCASNEMSKAEPSEPLAAVRKAKSKSYDEVAKKGSEIEAVQGNEASKG